jgi:hypothetical protein
MKNYIFVIVLVFFTFLPETLLAADISDSDTENNTETENDGSDILINRPRRPTSISFQYAGNLGLFSVGYGKSFFNDHLSLSLIYGYLPSSVNNVEVSTFAFKPLYNLKPLKITDNSYINGYVGACMLRGFTHNTFVKLAGYYTKGYYQPNAIHYTFYVGAKYKHLTPKSILFNNVSTFCELGTVEYLVWYGLKTRYIDFSDLWNLSFGFNFDIKRKPKNN